MHESGVLALLLAAPGSPNPISTMVLTPLNKAAPAKPASPEHWVWAVKQVSLCSLPCRGPAGLVANFPCLYKDQPH